MKNAALSALLDRERNKRKKRFTGITRSQLKVEALAIAPNQDSLSLGQKNHSWKARVVQSESNSRHR